MMLNGLVSEFKRFCRAVGGEVRSSRIWEQGVDRYACYLSAPSGAHIYLDGRIIEISMGKVGEIEKTMRATLPKNIELELDSGEYIRFEEINGRDKFNASVDEIEVIFLDIDKGRNKAELSFSRFAKA